MGSLDNQEQKSMAQIVRAEISQHEKKEYPDVPFENRALSYLNNFHYKLPSDSGLDQFEAEARRFRPQDLQRILDNRKVPEIDSRFQHLNPVYDKGKTKEQLFEELKADGFSERFLLGTREGLLNDVQTAIKQSGVDETVLKHCVAHIRETDAREIVRLLLPVYIKLREMGYEYEDLRLS